MTDKRLLRHALALGVLLVCAAALPRALSAQQRHGDVNGDGVVSALDAQAILTAVVGLSLPQGFIAANGDSNCDAATTALDAQIVLSHVIGLNVTPYCVNQLFGPAALTIRITPGDSSVLINRGLRLRAVLTDTGGATPQRPVAWSTSNPDLVAIDSSRGDTAWVGNHGAAFDATATVTATSDGVSSSTTIRVFRSYAGVIILPQRGDTLRQLNGTRTFTVADRDSVGTTITTRSSTTVTWSTLNPLIASVNASGVVTALTSGTTMLRVVSNTNTADRDSVPLVVMLPALSSCTGQGGTLYPAQSFATPQTWTAATNPHYVAGTLTFNATSRLTIEAGALVCLSSGASLTFQAGSEMIARGTADMPIRFLPTVADQPWGGITFGSVFTYSGTTTDTSVVTNTVFVRNGSAINGANQHTLILDSVHVRQANTVGVRILGPGSRLSRSVIDTAGVGGGASFAATIGRGTIEATTIRPGPNGSGIAVSEAGTVRDVTITGGNTGIGQTSGPSGLRLNNVSISGVIGSALDLANIDIDSSSGNVQVSDSRYGYRGRIGNLAVLFPDSIAQTTLVANTSDTVVFSGGSIRNRTLRLRPDITWETSSEIVVDTQAVLRLGPGVRMAFQNGGIRMTNSGRLIARGSAAAPVMLVPRPGVAFYGLTFENPPAPGGFTPTPRDTSYLVNVQVDSAGGYCGTGACAAVNSYDRHMVVIDSSRFRLSLNGAVALVAAGSRISRSVIDTTGNTTSSYPALYLGGSTVAENTVVRRSGQDGVSVGGAITDSVRLRALTILDSEGVGLRAEGARIAGDSGSVVATANAYPYRGYLDSFGAIARDSVAQLALLGNTDNRVEIVGRSDRRFSGRAGRIDSLRVIPQLPWMVVNDAYVDTLARLVPSPGSRIGFAAGYMYFTRGGQLHARGTAAAPIVLEKWSPSSGTFTGIQFANKGGAGLDTSYLVNATVRSVDSCLGGTLGCAALSTYDRHLLIVDSTTIDSTTYTAVSLSAPGSRISRSVIDRAGQPTTYAGLELGRATLAESTTVRRSRGTGVQVSGSVTAPGDTTRLRALLIQDGGGVALLAEGGRIVGDSGSVRATGNAYPFRGYIDNFAVIARDSVAQLNLLGNAADRVEIVGRSDRRFSGRPGRIDDLRVIPQLPWMLINDAYIDTLARLVPSPGSRIGFWGGNLVFSSGGRLLSRGTAASPVVLEKYSTTSGAFNGILFSNRGGTGLDTSYVINTQVRTVESCQGGTLGCAALATQDRHVLIVDSTTVDSTTYTAIGLSAPGSRISRSLIEQAGQPTSYAGLELGRATLAESTTVRASRGTGILVSGSVTAPGDTVRLRAITIQNSGTVALHAEGGRIVGDSGSVTATGNGYPFRGYIDNFAALAKDSVAQVNLLGNTTDRVEIVGRSDRRFSGRAGRIDSLRVIPQLPWMVVNDAYVDTLARLVPSPGSRIGFAAGYMYFTRGGQLHARGTAAAPIVLEKWSPSSGTFTGIQFANRGGATLDTSYLVNTRVRDVESCLGGALGCAALATEDRHVLIVDSTEVRNTTYTAVSLGAPGSRISRSLIDIAGQPTTYAGLGLGRVTLVESTTVQNARGTGVLVGGAITAPADTIRIRALTILNSGGVGLHAEGGQIVGDLGSVTATGNAFPFRGFIDNFATIARDSVSQDRLLNNDDNRVEIVGRSDRPLPPAPSFNGPTLVAIPQLRLQIQSYAYVDTLAEFAPRPGAQIRFTNNGALVFQRGAILTAVGTATNTIDFGPAVTATSAFDGLQFLNPGAADDQFSPDPIATSTMSYVNVDSAGGLGGGPFGCCAAVNGANRHRLLISNARFHRNFNGAVYLGAAGSALTSVRVDTTGNTTTSYAAVAMNDTTSATDLVVNRSGQIGIRIDGNGVSLTNALVTASQGNGIQIDNNNTAANGGSQRLQLSGFTVDGALGVGLAVAADSVQISNCDMNNGASHGLRTTTTGLTGVSITNCNFRGNAGQAVSNASTTGTEVITALLNWWNLMDGSGLPIVPPVGTANGPGTNVNASAQAERLP